MVEETYTETVLADEDEIKLARNKFLACMFLAGVDQIRYKDAIDELNNDYMRHGKDYPQDVQSMMEWLSKRRGTGGPSKREEEAAESVDQFCAGRPNKMSFLWRKGILRM